MRFFGIRRVRKRTPLAKTGMLICKNAKLLGSFIEHRRSGGQGLRYTTVKTGLGFCFARSLEFGLSLAFQQQGVQQLRTIEHQHSEILRPEEAVVRQASHPVLQLENRQRCESQACGAAVLLRV